MLFTKKKEEICVPAPKHVAVDLEGIGRWAQGQKIEVGDAYQKSFLRVLELVDQQVQFNIPVLTFFVMSPRIRGTHRAEVLLESFAGFLESSEMKSRVVSKKIKVTIIGKWYDLSQQVVEAIRRIAEETKDYDSFFLNFCLNYDGQEEIVDACKLIGRQIRLGKIDPEVVTKELIKENLYSSYFIPPDVFIRNGKERILSSLLLWDSVGARIFFTNKLFPDFTVDDFIRIVAGG